MPRSRAVRTDAEKATIKKAMRNRRTIQILPAQCSYAGCVRFPWSLIDNVPYCHPHGADYLGASKDGEG